MIIKFYLPQNLKIGQKFQSLSKKINVKISKIGVINNDKNIIFKYKDKEFKLTANGKMGYTHNF